MGIFAGFVIMIAVIIVRIARIMAVIMVVIVMRMVIVMSMVVRMIIVFMGMTCVFDEVDVARCEYEQERDEEC